MIAGRTDVSEDADVHIIAVHDKTMRFVRIMKFWKSLNGQFADLHRFIRFVCSVLLFFYIDALVLLIGAEINSEIDYEVTGMPRGSRDFRKSMIAKSDTESSLSPLI